MKTILPLLITTILLFVSPVHAAILIGPVTNPDNGHDYYLLTPNTWAASEVEAESLGGTLAIVKNAAEQQWIFTNFANWQGSHHVLWIGLHRQYSGGPFAWVTGETIKYWNWCDGQPDNSGGVEDSVCIWTPLDGWNDESDNTQNYGVVEVPGSSQKKSLTEKEKTLIGTWYETGRIDKPCYFAATENKLFAIGAFGQAGSAICNSDGSISVVSWHTRGEIVQDKILWSNGAWWSRTPSKFATEDSSPPNGTPYPEFRRGFPGF